jgi:hypothetical protein
MYSGGFYPFPFRGRTLGMVVETYLGEQVCADPE